MIGSSEVYIVSTVDDAVMICLLAISLLTIAFLLWHIFVRDRLVRQLLELVDRIISEQERRGVIGDPVSHGGGVREQRR